MAIHRADRPLQPPLKVRIGDLAVFGGRPAFDEALHVGRPNVGSRTRFFERLGQALDRRVLTNDGPLVREFEQRLRTVTGARHVAAVCNATTGIEIAIRALGLTGEVIVPAFTFIAPVHAVRWLGLRPVFCDVDPVSLTIDPDAAARAITPQTSAILGVHLWGWACQSDRLEALAERHGLRLIYDAAHALGCSNGRGPVGGARDLEVFSFHATKFVNAFEGGAIATNDEEIGRVVDAMRNFGFVDWDRTASVGTNGKMSEVSAAMGLTSLEAMPEFMRANRHNRAAYEDALAGLEGLRLHDLGPHRPHNCQHVVVRVDGERSPIRRDDLHRVLTAEGVLARRYFAPGCHRMEPYRADGGPSLPHAERASDEMLSLPTGTAVGEPDVRAIGALIRFCWAHGGDIARRLAQG